MSNVFTGVRLYVIKVVKQSRVSGFLKKRFQRYMHASSLR